MKPRLLKKFHQNASQRRRSSDRSERRLRLETLESRRLLASDVEIVDPDSAMIGSYLRDDDGTTVIYTPLTTGSPGFANAQIGSDVIESDLSVGRDVVIRTNEVPGTGQGDIRVRAPISSSNSNATTLRFEAEDDVIVQASIGSNIGPLDLIFNADTDATNGGTVSIVLSATDVINSAGGRITIGGGVDPETTPAIGNTANPTGVSISGLPGSSILQSVGGNISIRGQGFSGLTGVPNDGVSVRDAFLQSDSGGITITGVGEGTVGANAGVSLFNSFVESFGGGVTINGQTASSDGTGVRLSGLTSITDLGGGNINVLGTAAAPEGFAISIGNADLRIETVGTDIRLDAPIGRIGTPSGTSPDSSIINAGPSGNIQLNGPLIVGNNADSSPPDEFGDFSFRGNLISGPSSFIMSFDDAAKDQIVLNSQGSINLNDAVLNVDGNLTSSLGQVITVVDNRSITPIIGTFNGLAEGNTVTIDALMFSISYVGGDGNDVTLTETVFAGGPFVVSGDDTDEDFLVELSGPRVVIFRNGIEIGVFDQGLLTELTINAAGGNDTLTVDYTEGDPVPVDGITFNGGDAGNDSMTLTGGSVTQVTHTFINANDGNVDVDGGLITYTGLEPILDNLDAIDREFDFRGGDETITLRDADPVIDGQMFIDSTLGESVTFTNPTSSLSIFAGSGDDIIDIATLDAGNTSGLFIDGGEGSGDRLNMTDVSINTNRNSFGLVLQELESINITGGVIENNLTFAGGGISIYNSTSGATTQATLDAVTIQNNETIFGSGVSEDGLGGGIYTEGVVLRIQNNSIISGNTAIDSGGGIYLEGGQLILENSLISSNRANGIDSGGGGVYVFGNGPTSPAFTIINTDFTGNTSDSGGGGLEIVDTPGSIIGGTYELNRVLGGALAAEGGGGIVIVGTDDALASPVTIDSVLIRQNAAPTGGGIAATNPRLIITNSTIQNNTTIGPGGGIGAISINSLGSVELNGVVVSENTAAGDGGGIGTSNVNLRLTDTTVSGNQSSAGRAGGIGFQGVSLVPILTAQRVTIDNNSAASVGGGVGIVNAGFELTNTTVSDNTAGGQGGGLFFNDAILGPSPAPRRIAFSTFGDNVSFGQGNGSNINVDASGNPITLRATLFANGVSVLGQNGAYLSEGYNVHADAPAGLTDATDQVNVDIVLSPLAGNGGFVRTRLNSGVGVDTVPVALAPTTDTRGVPRTGSVSTLADAGAFERIGVEIQTPTFFENQGVQSASVRLDRNVPFDIVLSTPAATLGTPAAVTVPATSLTFVAGQSQIFQNLPFTLIDNSIVDLGSRVIAGFATQFNPLIASDDLVIIQNDDKATLTFSDPVVNEAAGTVTFVVTSDAQVVRPFLVDYSTADGTAIAPGDYTATAGTLRFTGTANETVSFDVPIINDSNVEGAESLTVSLSNVRGEGNLIFPVGDIVITDTGTATINDDDLGTFNAADTTRTINQDSPETSVDLSTLITNAIGPANYSLVSSTSGTARVVGSTLFFTPATGFAGQSTVVYEATGFGGSPSSPVSDQGVITFTVVPVNVGNLVNDDVFFVAPGGVNTLDVLANDNAAPGQSITIVSTSPANQGTVQLDSVNQRILYTPAPGFLGGDTFTYTVSSGGLIASAMVTINLAVQSPVLTGHVFCDANGDGRENSGEVSIGSRVFIDQNNNGIDDINEPFTLTDSLGNYEFNSLPPNARSVTLIVDSACSALPEQFPRFTNSIDLGHVVRDSIGFDFDGDGSEELITVSEADKRLSILSAADLLAGVASRSPIFLADRPQALDAYRTSGPNGSTSVIAVAAFGGTLSPPSGGQPDGGIRSTSPGAIYSINSSGLTERFEIGRGPFDVEVDDFDGDQRPDYLVAGYLSNDFQVRLSSSGETRRIADGSAASHVNSGDFNADGIRDVVLGSYGFGSGGGALAVRFGDGAGNFSSQRTIPLSSKVITTAVGDFALGIPGDELAVLESDGALTIYTVTPSGVGLLSQIRLAAGTSKLEAGFLDGDDLIDLAASNTTAGTLELMLGRGLGTFERSRTIREVASPADVVFANMSGASRRSLMVVEQALNSQGSSTTVLRLGLDQQGLTIQNNSMIQADFNPSSNFSRFDVNRDGRATSLDALQIINEINANEASSEPVRFGADSRPSGEPVAGDRITFDVPSQRDVNRDGHVTALDALLVINHLNDLDRLATDTHPATGELVSPSPADIENTKRRAIDEYMSSESFLF